MARRESNLTRRILRELNKLPKTLAFKIHGGPYQVSGIPDICCVHQGRTIWFEVKLPGEKPDPIQIVFHNKLRSAGAEVYVITLVEEAVSNLSALTSQSTVPPGMLPL